MSEEILNYGILSAEDYKLIVRMMYGRAPKTYICTRLRISRPTHDHWLKHGITRSAQVRRIRTMVGEHTTDLRQRARVLDRWTNQHRISEPVKRLPHYARA